MGEGDGCSVAGESAASSVAVVLLDCPAGVLSDTRLETDVFRGAGVGASEVGAPSLPPSLRTISCA